MTVTGLDGEVGAYVPKLAVEALRIEQEPAPIPHLFTVAEIVLERTRKFARAITGHVQVNVFSSNAQFVISKNNSR